MKFLTITLAVTLIVISNMSFANNNAASFKDAVANGEVNLNFRYRMEDVSQDNTARDALASTLRSRLTFKTQKFNDFSVLFEVDDVSVIGNSDGYNSLLNNVDNRSVVADPEVTNLNQSAISYTGFKNTKIIFGRQRINLGNQRFVGGVAWRQNEQTYDGLTFVNQSIPNSRFIYSYINNVNSILDNNRDTDIHLLDYSWNGSELLSVSAYSYFIDFNDSPDASTRTLGFNIKNAKKNKSNFLWHLEYASQTDYADSSKDLSEKYYRLEGGYNLDGIIFRIGREVLTGDANNPGNAFQTPFATKHKFQGWADLFLGTPDAGIKDSYLLVSGKLAGNKVVVVYHDFKAQDNSLDYGSEINFLIVRKLSDEHKVAFKYADYNADQLNVDTRKYWISFIANY